jgi:hypothetical protein
MAAGAVGAAAIGAKGAKDAAKIAGSTTYERIDLDELQKRAQTVARENAINSLALEAELTPDVAKARRELATQVSNELAMNGQISPDVARQVAQRSITGATASGLSGVAGPITAASLGLTAMDLTNQRQAKAASLLALNPLPESGLSPGSLASAAVADLNAANQFNISKTQAQANAAQARANAIASGLSGVGSGIGSAIMFKDLFKDPNHPASTGYNPAIAAGGQTYSSPNFQAANPWGSYQAPSWAPKSS